MGDPDLAGGQTIVGLGWGWGDVCSGIQVQELMFCMLSRNIIYVCACVCVCARVSFFLVPRGQNKTSKASRLSFINANQCVWNEVKYMNAATEIVVGWDSLVSLANWAPSFHWWTRGDSSGGNQDKVPSWVPFQWTNVLKRPLFTLNIDFLHTGSYSWCPFHIFCPCPSNIMSPPVSLTLLTLSRSLTPVAS